MKNKISIQHLITKSDKDTTLFSIEVTKIHCMKQVENQFKTIESHFSKFDPNEWVVGNAVCPSVVSCVWWHYWENARKIIYMIL
jgi:hypothetical protein